MHKNIEETSDKVKAMDNIRQAVTSVQFSGESSSRAFVFGEDYIIWETNRVCSNIIA